MTIDETVPGAELRGAGWSNSDRVATLAGPSWWVVADGIGASTSASTAARAVVDAFAGSPCAVSHHAATERISAVHRRVSDLGVGGAGVATSALAAVGSNLAVAHVGDARCYRLRGGMVDLLTRDHSVAQEWSELGGVPSERVASHRLRRVVSRALGTDLPHRPDVLVVPFEPARILLCSAALAQEVPERSVGRVLSAMADPAVAAQRLVALAGGVGAGAVVVDVIVRREAAA